MKFKIEIWKNFEDGAKPQYITGFLTLEDAIDSGFALARRRNSGVINIEPAGKRRGYLSEERLAGIYPEHLDLESQPRTLERARGNLVKFKAKLKAERARDRFVREHGGWASGLIDRILHDEAIKAAFFANDFATVEKLLAETALPVNSGENKP